MPLPLALALPSPSPPWSAVFATIACGALSEGVLPEPSVVDPWEAGAPAGEAEVGPGPGEGAVRGDAVGVGAWAKVTWPELGWTAGNEDDMDDMDDMDDIDGVDGAAVEAAAAEAAAEAAEAA